VPWDRELHVLEEAIRRLTADYDAFLYGTGAKPPVEGRKHVEEMIRQLNAAPSDAAADQYRFATLQGRYNALRDRWERLQSEKESGRRPGLYGHFAGGAGESAPPHPAPAATRPNVSPLASVQQSREARSPERDLFDRYVTAKRARGESVSEYTYEHFVKTLEAERQKLRQRLGDEDVVFDVAERDGRVRLVARRRRQEGSKS
jgi:hypothetical protein